MVSIETCKSEAKRKGPLPYQGALKHTAFPNMKMGHFRHFPKAPFTSEESLQLFLVLVHGYVTATHISHVSRTHKCLAQCL